MSPPSRPAAAGSDVVAAGAVVLRKGRRGHETLLVHRPKYDDWSFPKGKQDPGEHVTLTAVREVLEETGVEIRLGRPLRPQHYAVGGGRGKVVHYWVASVVGDDDVSGYEPNAEVDELVWLPLEEAAHRLSYLDDLALLEQVREEPRRTTPLVIVRHAKAVKRRRWKDEDTLRPLTGFGHEQARMLRGLLHAYGVTQVVTSPAVRCSDTVAPYAQRQVLQLQHAPELSEDHHDPETVRKTLLALAAGREASVVCSHRPVLPDVFATFAVEEEPLAPGELVVIHLRRGTLVATERHIPG